MEHVVSRDGIESDPRKVKAIDAFTLDRMQTPRDITVFLQTASFMRKFIRNFSQISAPLAKYQRKARRVGLGKDWKETRRRELHLRR